MPSHARTARMAVAGLWEGVKLPNHTATRAFTNITANANAQAAELHHDRMSIIFEQKEWPAWLGEVQGDLAVLMRPADLDVVEGLAGQQAGEFAEELRERSC